MSIEYKAWVSETGTLTGTDPTYTLPGTASTPSGNQFFRKVSAAFTATATVVLTITAATGAETSVWTYTPGASGAPGTISRVTLLESSTGSTINWSGVAANISGDIPSPILSSAGAASAGQIPALNNNGVLDGTLTKGLLPLQPGEYYLNPNGGLFSYSPQASKLYFIWFPVPNEITLKTMQLSSYGTPSAAISFRFGVYSADQITGAPSNLLSDLGSVTISTNTTPSLSFPNSGLDVVAPGVWLAVGMPSTLSGWSAVCFNAPHNIGFPSDQSPNIGNINNAIIYCGYSISSWTFGPMPATAAGATYDNHNSSFPLVSIGT